MSNQPHVPSDTWGPDARRAAVTVTFDNLGEAADLERGLWPEGDPLGQHFSVKRMLPRILGMLGGLGLRATFFVEGLNAELYPEALLEVADSGHEIGYHGWRHEYWPDLSPSDEARLLERGIDKMDELGIRPRGFRPPGFLGDLVVMPFEWRLVDAYYYLPRFGDLRKSATGSHDPMSPARFRETLSSALQGVVRDGGHLTLLFHPFLEEQEDRFEIMRGALEEVGDLVQDGVVWCAPYREVTSWVLNYPRAFGNGLQLDPTEA